jgi:hypothetical protein
MLPLEITEEVLHSDRYFVILLLFRKRRKKLEVRLKSRDFSAPAEDCRSEAGTKLPDLNFTRSVI